MKSLVILVLIYLVQFTAGDEWSTSSNPVDVFTHSGGDGLNIRFAHAANSVDKWEAAMFEGEDERDMIEVDVQVSTSGQVILHHDPGQATGGNVENFLQDLLQLHRPIYTGQIKGVKFDFKRKEAVTPTMDQLVTFQNRLLAEGSTWNSPVWINADVIPGPNADSTDFKPLEAEEFIRNVTEVFPNVTLSLGWVTSHPDAGGEPMEERYTWRMMLDMLRNVVPHTSPHQPVTFPVRAKWLTNSWQGFYWLYSQLPGNFSLTIWSSVGDNPSDESLQALKTLREALPLNAIFYDAADTMFRTRFQTVLDDPGRPAHDLPNWPQLSWWRLVDSDNKLINPVEQDEEIRGNRQFQNKKAFIGEEGTIIGKNSYVIQTRQEHEAGETKLSGTVQFLVSEEAEELDTIPSQASEAHVFIRTANISNVVASLSDGVRLKIDRDGEVVLSETGVPSVAETDRLTQDIDDGCFQFEIIDKGENVAVTARVNTCNMGTSNQVEVSKQFPYEKSNQGFYLGLGRGGEESDGEVMFRQVEVTHTAAQGGGSAVSASLSPLLITVCSVIINKIFN